MPAITAFRVQTKKVGGRKASDPLPANRKAALLQSALPWTITDSTPSAHRWVWRTAYSPYPPLFSNGVVLLEVLDARSFLQEAATSPLHVLVAARRFFIPRLLAFGRLSAVPRLPARPNRFTSRSRGWRCATDSCPPHCCEAVFPGYSCPSPGCHRCHC